MTWQWLFSMMLFFAITWIGAGILIFKKEKSPIQKKLEFLLPLLGNLSILVFIIFLWIELERPPMKSLAETRLWYSFFIAWVTWFIFLKTRSKPMYLLGFMMAFVFLLVDLLRPEYHNKNLMPALQSPWFIPHVVIYMISYAVLGSACISAIIGRVYYKKTDKNLDNSINLAMQLVYPGLGLLTLGMLIGAIWAKIAWGNYWTWDPKETWALLTWLFYMLTIHIHYFYPNKKKLLSNLLMFSFLVLIITWLGIRYLPSAAESMHVY